MPELTHDIKVHHEHQGRVTYWWVTCSLCGTMIQPTLSKSMAMRIAVQHSGMRQGANNG